jgi:hypothetical protein
MAFNFRWKVGISLAAQLLAVSSFVSAGFADSVSAGRSWSGSWGPSNTAEKNYRLSLIDTQQKLNNGYYNGLGTHTTNTFYDSSVGAITITGEQDANIDLQIRSGNGSGDSTTTTSNSVGATNTSNTNVTIDGSSNMIDVTSTADSTGCQDGSIQHSTSVVDTVDISSTAGFTTNNTSGDSSC